MNPDSCPGGFPLLRPLTIWFTFCLSRIIPTSITLLLCQLWVDQDYYTRRYLFRRTLSFSENHIRINGNRSFCNTATMHHSNLFSSLLITLLASPTTPISLGERKDCVQVQCFVENICADSLDAAISTACYRLTEMPTASGNVYWTTDTTYSDAGCSILQDNLYDDAVWLARDSRRAAENCNGTTGIVPTGNLIAWRSQIYSEDAPAPDSKALAAGRRVGPGGKIWGCFVKKKVRCEQGY